jgi:hypothetical protein
MSAVNAVRQSLSVPTCENPMVSADATVATVSNAAATKTLSNRVIGSESFRLTKVGWTRALGIKAMPADAMGRMHPAGSRYFTGQPLVIS